MSKYWNDDNGAAYRSMLRERDRRVASLRLQARALAAGARSALDDVIRLEGLLRREGWSLGQLASIKNELHLCRLEAQVYQRDSCARYRHARLLMGMNY